MSATVTATPALARAVAATPTRKRLHAIVDRDRRRAILQHVLREVLQLVRVRVAEALHEIRHGVVRHAVGLGHHHDRRLAQVADANGAFEAEDLRRDVVAVNAAARQVDDAELAARERQAGNRVVDVADAWRAPGYAIVAPMADTVFTSPMNQRARSKS